MTPHNGASEMGMHCLLHRVSVMCLPFRNQMNSYIFDDSLYVGWNLKIKINNYKFHRFR